MHAAGCKGAPRARLSPAARFAAHCVDVRKHLRVRTAPARAEALALRTISAIHRRTQRRNTRWPVLRRVSNTAACKYGPTFGCYRRIQCQRQRRRRRRGFFHMPGRPWRNTRLAMVCGCRARRRQCGCRGQCERRYCICRRRRGPGPGPGPRPRPGPGTRTGTRTLAGGGGLGTLRRIPARQVVIPAGLSTCIGLTSFGFASWTALPWRCRC